MGLGNDVAGIKNVIHQDCGAYAGAVKSGGDSKRAFLSDLRAAGKYPDGKSGRYSTSIRLPFGTSADKYDVNTCNALFEKVLSGCTPGGRFKGGRASSDVFTVAIFVEPEK